MNFMSDIDTNELLYVAGIGLFLNITVFVITLLVYRCKTRGESYDLEAAMPFLGLNNGEDAPNDASQEEEEREIDKRCRLIDLIPAVEFKKVAEEEEEREATAFAGDGCSICLREEFEEEDMCKVLPECHHVFHSDCIDCWFKTNKKQNCPVCRKVFRVVVRPVS